jgi:hypothetical protein
MGNKNPSDKYNSDQYNSFGHIFVKELILPLCFVAAWQHLVAVDAAIHTGFPSTLIILPTLVFHAQGSVIVGGCQFTHVDHRVQGWQSEHWLSK